MTSNDYGATREKSKSPTTFSMVHVVLLGDSIFDNKAYTGDEPDVVSHLRQMFPPNWDATLKAVDGSLVENIEAQLQDFPRDATHIVISGGGNNALMNADLLQMRANSSAEVFLELSNRTTMFDAQYGDMLEKVVGRGLPITVSTVYFPNFPDETIQAIAVSALSAFNDVIIRQAVLHGLPVLDLRLICSEKSDYANEIEPSGLGGKKIATKIKEVIETHDFTTSKTTIYM